MHSVTVRQELDLLSCESRQRIRKDFYVRGLTIDGIAKQWGCRQYTVRRVLNQTKGFTLDSLLKQKEKETAS